VKNRTVLVIAHRLHSIRHADLILVLDEGRLVEHGRHDQLIEKEGLYARLWQASENR
jgi:ATP-binding cassette subfamily B protein IrtB